jgi:hypothetical protein
MKDEYNNYAGSNGITEENAERAITETHRGFPLMDSLGPVLGTLFFNF